MSAHVRMRSKRYPMPSLDELLELAGRPPDANSSRWVLASRGIETVTVTAFDWGGRRFWNIHDALAAANEHRP